MVSTTLQSDKLLGSGIPRTFEEQKNLICYRAECLSITISVRRLMPAWHGEEFSLSAAKLLPGTHSWTFDFQNESIQILG